MMSTGNRFSLYNRGFTIATVSEHERDLSPGTTALHETYDDSI
jgi:hypothetical protein